MYLRYFLKNLLLPPLAQLVLLVLAWQFRKRLPKTARFIFLVGLTSLWALGTPPVATHLAASLEKYQALRPEELDSLAAEAIVILSAGQNDTTSEFGQPVSDYYQLARLRYGAFLAKRTGLPVLVTGGSVFGDDTRSGAETMAFDLDAGFGIKAAWREGLSRTTAENALFSYRILAPERKTTILLVTNAIHMVRAKWSFEQAGFTVIAAPTMFIDRRPLTILSFFPTAASLELSSQALHEWLGYWAYRLVWSAA